MTNFGISIISMDYSSGESSTSLFVTSSTIGIKHALIKVIKHEFKVEEKLKTLTGYAYAPELGEAWKYDATFSKSSKLNLKITKIEYPKGITKTEKLFSEYSFKPVGELSSEPKTSKLENKINDFISKYDGEYETGFHITTGADFYVQHSTYSIRHPDISLIEKLMTDGKRVSIIALDTDENYTSGHPFTVENIPIAEYSEENPKKASILKLKFSDFSD